MNLRLSHVGRLHRQECLCHREEGREGESGGCAGALQIVYSRDGCERTNYEEIVSSGCDGAHLPGVFCADGADELRRAEFPPKVPFLFANIVRRLVKDYKPDYIGIVFDTQQADVPRQII